RTVVVPAPAYAPVVTPRSRSGELGYADPRNHDPRYLGYRRYAYDPRYRGTTVVVTEGSPPPVLPSFGTREVEEISRNLTVQCSFTLIDAVTGQSIVQFSPPPYQKLDKSSPNFLFGAM